MTGWIWELCGQTFLRGWYNIKILLFCGVWVWVCLLVLFVRCGWWFVGLICFAWLGLILVATVAGFMSYLWDY